MAFLSTYPQSHYIEVPQWEIFMKRNWDLGWIWTGWHYWKYLKKILSQETFLIVSCSNRDTSPRDFSIMTLPTPQRWHFLHYKRWPKSRHFWLHTHFLMSPNINVVKECSLTIYFFALSSLSWFFHKSRYSHAWKTCKNISPMTKFARIFRLCTAVSSLITLYIHLT